MRRKAKPLHLGSLGLMEYFRLPGSPVKYRTITYPPMNTSSTIGVRWVLNMKSLTAHTWLCNKKVVKCST